LTFLLQGHERYGGLAVHGQHSHTSLPYYASVDQLDKAVSLLVVPMPWTLQDMSDTLHIGRKMNNWVLADLSAAGGPFSSLANLQELWVPYPTLPYPVP
jgi:hypothetical protein